MQPPGWLLDLLLDTVPPDDRSRDRHLFTWPQTGSSPGQTVAKTMGRACEAAGMPHFHPHDLRHYRISLWHGQGIPAREIGERVGQRQISTTLDVYTHVMPLAEITERAYAERLHP